MTAGDDALSARLRRLDGTELAALVADLWAARDFNTERTGEVVEATRDGRSVRIHAVPAGSRRAPEGADVVVAPGGVADADVRVVDAEELSERLAYAVEPAAAAGICERHLGAPPDELAAPIGRRLREAVRPAAFVALLALVGAGVALGGAFAPPAEVAGSPGDGIDPVPGTPAPASAASDPAGTLSSDDRDDPTSLGASSANGVAGFPPSEAPGEERAVRGELPPGVDRGGIADLDALAAAHGRAVAGRNYTVRVAERRSQEWIEPTTAVGSELTTEFVVAGDRYLLAAALGSGSERQHLRTLYRDGDSWRGVETIRGEVVYRNGTGRPPASTTPRELRQTVASRYLSAPRTALAGQTTRGGRVLYRVTGSGQPAAPSLGYVHNYSVEALVTADGVVRALTAEYDVVTGDRVYPVRVRVSYAGLGADMRPLERYRERTSRAGRSG